MTMTKYQELEKKIKELQAEVERLKNEEWANKLPEEFTREEVIRFLQEPSFEALDYAFTWESAPPGIEYWAKIGDGLVDNDEYKVPDEAIIQLQKWVIQSYQEEFGK